MSDARGPAPASDPKALFDQGLELLYGKDTEEQKKGFALIKQASEQKYPEAFLILGECYYYGRGVPKNKEQALVYYDIAAHTYHLPKAFYLLGYSYYYDYDFRDEEKAKRYLSKAADQNVPGAGNSLGYFHLEHKQYTDAISSFKKDTENDYAFFNLGALYALGKGVPKNLKTALNYFRQAETKGFNNETLKEFLSPSVYDKDREFLSSMYQKKDTPSRLEFLTCSDHDTFTKLANKYYYASEYGRAILFSALAAMFSPDSAARDKYLEFITAIINNPPFWDSTRILDFANVFKDVVLEHHANPGKRPNTQDAFEYLWLASGSVLQNKDKYPTDSDDNFWRYRKVSDKFEESYVSIMKTEDHMTQREAEKRLAQLKKDVSEVVKAEQKGSLKPKTPPEEKKPIPAPAVSAQPPIEFLKGIQHVTGQGVEKNIATALDYFRQAESKGLTEDAAKQYFERSGNDPTENIAYAIYQLRNETGVGLFHKGLNYAEGRTVKEDQKIAFDLFWAASKSNLPHPKAFGNLGYMYDQGKGVPQNVKEALRYLQIAADTYNIPEICYSLGARYSKGIRGVEKDLKKAAHYFKIAADKFREAETGETVFKINFRLGIMYAVGQGVEKDILKSREHFCRVVDDKSIQAYFKESADSEEKLAYPIYQNRHNPLSPDELYQQALEFVKQEDSKKAFDLFLQVAEKKPMAYCHLVGFYEKGVAGAVEKDEKKSMACLKKAADAAEKNPVEMDNPAYIFNQLGIAYYKGKGGVQDYKEALNYFEKSANLKYPSGLFNLGLLYATGRGVEKNIATALDYFHQAELKGFSDKHATEYFKRREADLEEQRIDPIYQRRNIPLGFLLREEDIPGFNKFADDYVGRYGRRLIFSALSVAFSPTATQRKTYQGYIEEIKESPPIKDRAIILDFANFMEKIALDEKQPYHLKKLKELYNVDEPFVLFHLALEKLSEKSEVSGKFVTNVSNKLKESFFKIYKFHLGPSQDKIEAAYRQILAARDKLLDSIKKETKSPAERVKPLEVKIAESPSSREVKVQQHQPMGAVPVMPSEDTSPSAPSLLELFGVPIEQIDKVLREEHKLEAQNSPKAMSLERFEEYSKEVNKSLSEGIKEIENRDEKRMFIENSINIKTRMHDVLFLKKSRIQAAKLQRLIRDREENSTAAILGQAEKESLPIQLLPAEKLDDLISGPILSSDSVTAEQPESVAIALPQDSSIQLFEDKLTAFEKKLSEAKANPKKADIPGLSTEHFKLVKEMSSFSQEKLNNTIYKKLDDLLQSLLQLEKLKSGKVQKADEQKLFSKKNPQTNRDVSVSHGAGGTVLLPQRGRDGK